MKAVVITKPGAPEVLQVLERPKPEPVGEQVRVRVLAAGVNRADIMQRMGRYPAPSSAPADIPGLEFAGVVDATGSLVHSWKPGQRVFGIVGGGAYAEYLLTHERLLAEIPENLDFVDAAAVPEVFMTAHDALFTQAEMAAGERVLVHATGSGVGTAAVQLVRAVNGTSYGTARSAEKLERAREYGLDVALPLPDFIPALQKATGNAGVNIVIDFVGAPYLDQNLAALAPLGRLVQVGTMGGATAELNLGMMMGKRLRLIGTVLRARPIEEKVMVTRRFVEQVVPLLAKGVVRPVVDKVFPLDQAAEAQAYMESNASFGKIVLKVAER